MPCGVDPARGALLPHRFTLATHILRCRSAVCFLLHFPSAHAAQALPGTVPCGARTFPADSTPQTDKGAHAPRPRARSRPGRMALMRGLAILVWVGMLVFVPFAEKLELEKSFALAIVGCATLILLFATARASFRLPTFPQSSRSGR